MTDRSARALALIDQVRAGTTAAFDRLDAAKRDRDQALADLADARATIDRVRALEPDLHLRKHCDCCCWPDCPGCAIRDALTGPGDSASLVCGCGSAPDGAPGANGCSPTCMHPEPPTAPADADVARVRAHLAAAWPHLADDPTFLDQLAEEATRAAYLIANRPVAARGCDDCSVEPGETHRHPGCPGAAR
jgi:hypothetical protein